MAHEALLWMREGDRVRCGLCPHSCVVPEGGHGLCGARGVEGGVLRALTYGLVSSAAADPIEKKPVFHFHPGSDVFSLGGVGCSMRCGHCQNWQISRPQGDDGTVPLHYLDPQAVPQMAVEAKCEGVAFTYNEPVIWLEYVLDTARLAKERGLYTVMVTNGYVTPEGLDLFADCIDVWRVDIKGFSEQSYQRLCHVRHADAVRAAAERAVGVHGMHVECVTNIVPGINDSPYELRSIAEWISTRLGPLTPWHLTRFVPYLEFAHVEPTPLEALQRARDIGREAELAFVYLGNVLTSGGEDTVCPGCGAIAVSRRGFSATVNNVTEQGACGSCGAALNMCMTRGSRRVD